jgi:hypothetical protein
MAKWLDELFSLNKEASTNAQQEFQKKVKASGWVDGVMNIDEPTMAKEADAKMVAELKIRDEVVKEAAYEAFQTPTEVLDQDYLRDVKILSDYQLAEWLAEYRAHNKNLPYPEMASELKEEAKKDIKNDRSACEKELLKLHADNTLLDWQKSFKKFSEWKNEQPKESDLYQPKLEKVNDDLSKGAKVDEYALTDEQHAKTTLGLGRDEHERTDVTAQPGETKNEALGKISEKTAALVRDPDTELKVGGLVRLARSVMSHEGIILPEGSAWEITAIDGFHYTISANGEKHIISSHDTPKFNKIASQSVLAKSQAWDVFLNGKNIDTVFYSEGAKVDADEVKRSLVDHDGYDANIVVKKGSQEITNHATKEQIITKLAEINSPWAVVIKDGQEVVARVVDDQVVKESEEDKKDLSK